LTILSFPTLSRTPSGASHRLRGNTQTHRSPLDGTTQTLEMPGAVWELSVRWESLPESDWRVLGAFLANLRGRQGRFTFSPAIFAPRRGTGTGTPVITAANDTGIDLNTSGWTASAPNVFLAGDWFSFTDAGGRTRLHMATADVSANAGGAATVLITPPVRLAASAGAAIQVAAPIGVFMLADDAAPEIEVRAPRLGSVTLTMVEALV
jgi:hypothetical protein